MTPERWQQIKEVLHHALELAPEQRSSFLEKACSGDHSLRNQVDSLLFSNEEARSGFLCSSVVRVTLTNGTMLGDYEVQNLIGSGGMGEVYRAHDARLGRDVAIKVLPSFLSLDTERLRRFEQEARAAAKLNHPNILSVFQMGTYEGKPYLVSELLEGVTLREQLDCGPLPIHKSIDYGLQFARGLAAAYDKGIVHRDLKPENLFVTKDGRIKILDFGLAKLTQTITPSDGSAGTINKTLPGVVMGTVGYMSPEQVRGQAADHRADIFAFGAVLYEMLTGQRAFQTASSPETMTAILKEDPKAVCELAPSTPKALERVVHRCLGKSPELRFQSASDLAFALQASHDPGTSSTSAIGHTRAPKKGVLLRWVFLGVAIVATLSLVPLSWKVWRSQSHGAAQIQSLAVLPLQNLSQEADQDYFADSMTEALITQLAKIKELRVISRTSAMRFKNTTESVPEIARKLNVDAVVEGSVERAGSRVRITAQLIRASTEKHIWAESFDRDLRDVLLLQSEVAQNIARGVQVSISPDDRARLSGERQVDPEAYQLYVKGRYFWIKRTPQTVNQAIVLFNQAVAKDPNYAEAYSGLADAYASLGFSFDVGSIAPNLVQPKAHAFARKAMELNERLPEAHNSLAYWKLNYGWDWAGAEEEFHRSLDLNPGYANAHHWYAHQLISSGRMDEALAESKKALEIDQLSPIMNVHLGWHYFFARQYDHSLDQLRKTLELDPNYGLAFWYTGWVYEQIGKPEEAIGQMLRAKQFLKGNLVVEADLAHAYGIAGKKSEARKILAGLRSMSEQTYVNPYEIALIHLGLGEKEQAFQSLNEAIRDRSDLMIYLKLDPRMDPIRSDPRFTELVRNVGIP